MTQYDVILCGPITGVPDYHTRFALAFCEVRKRHMDATGKMACVWNPAILPAGRSTEWYMRRCVKAIFDSPKATVVMLPGWENSLGAIVENALSRCLNMRIETL